jgi:hypothetical protein
MLKASKLSVLQKRTKPLKNLKTEPIMIDLVSNSSCAVEIKDEMDEELMIYEPQSRKGDIDPWVATEFMTPTKDKSFITVNDSSTQQSSTDNHEDDDDDDVVFISEKIPS